MRDYTFIPLTRPQARRRLPAGWGWAALAAAAYLLALAMSAPPA